MWRDEVRLRSVLEQLYRRYDHRRFVDPDPLLFLYRYDDVRDREVAGLVSSALAFGGVRQIMASVARVLDVMGDSPAGFLETIDRKDMYEIWAGFRHRWAGVDELTGLLTGISSVMREYRTIENAFISGMSTGDEDVMPALSVLVEKISAAGAGSGNRLIPDPGKGSACKRLNLFLRWMVREDRVDPGGWRSVSSSKLLIPLDVHMHRIAAFLGFTGRKPNDIRTAREVTAGFRRLDRNDPVRYDFAMTRLGIRRDEDRMDLVSTLGLDLDEKGRVYRPAGKSAPEGVEEKCVS
ncbi:MAG: TIGR02757 family protein [Bacteroidales bacterium]|nr:TIGR02757 family protein [Candidatus Latescibacterota bacterium]